MKVSSILEAKGPRVITIKPSDTIAMLAERLREERIGAAVVSSDGRTVEGMISERDLAYGLAEHKGNLHAMPVSALMTKTVIACSPDDSVANVAIVGVWPLLSASRMTAPYPPVARSTKLGTLPAAMRKPSVWP